MAVHESQSLCPRCGSNRYEDLAPGRSRCAECGLGRSSQPLVAQPRSTGTTVPPEIAAEQMQRLKAHAANQRSMFLDAPFDFFGLDEQWQGLRWIGGSGTSDGQVHHLVLGHGDDLFDPDVPVVRIDTRVAPAVLGDRESDLVMERFNFTRQQIGDFWRATGVLRPQIRAAAFTPGEVAQDPTGPWESETIPIDGSDTTFAVLRYGDDWVGQAQLAGRLIGVDAHGWPPRRTGLVTVGPGTLDEYTRGSDELWNRRRPGRG